MGLIRNPEREARLLEEWRKGSSAREAARLTGTPEGTVYYYWKRFNRDPERANRLSMSLKPRRKLSPMEVLMQLVKVESAHEIQAKFDQLIKEAKYVEAEHDIRAMRAARHFRREEMANVNSIM